MNSELVDLKIIYEPSVFLVGRPAINQVGIDEFLDSHDLEWAPTTDAPSDILAECAGRICYMSYNGQGRKSNIEYIDHIKKVGHGSVLEHATFNFIITGVSRSFTHELVRHRIGVAFSQLSQRYVDESDVAFVLPPVLQNLHDAELINLWRNSCRTSLIDYCQMVATLEEKLGFITDKTARRKAARGTARSVLPNSTETKIFFSGNTRALRHFVEMRCSEYADLEIRNVAARVLGILQHEAPAIFSDYETASCVDGGVSAKTTYRKV